MSEPGWYPDPQDRAWLRYYNGRDWTGERQRALATEPVPSALLDDDRTVPRSALPSRPPRSTPRPEPRQPQARSGPGAHQLPFTLPAPTWPAPPRRPRRRRVVAGLS